MSLKTTLRIVASHPLNRDHRTRALLRYLRWQTRLRVSPEGVVHEWVNGSRILIQRGGGGTILNAYNGLAEFEEMAFLLHFLRAGDAFVDVGANAGAYTVLACAAVGSKVLAFEPLPATYARLVANVRLNGAQVRVHCVNAALGSASGTLEFTAGLDAENHALAPGESTVGTARVAVTTLDGEASGMSPAMLKIDVEGFEFPVVKGAVLLLTDPVLRAVVIELNGSSCRYSFTDDDVMAAMRGHGFAPCQYDPFTRMLSDLPGKNHASGNTLFIRDRDFVVRRLAEAPVFFVNGVQI
jgi:FkbM family methyltransferase